jgi:hypothetical protein
VENKDCMIKSLCHRGYGREEGHWNFNEPLVLLTGRAQSPAVSHTLALCDALWGEMLPATPLLTARVVKLELECAGTHIAINRSRRPGVGPGRCDLSIYLDNLKQMGNSRRLCALLDEILPWRRGLLAWVDYLWDRQPFGRSLAFNASNNDYAGRLMERLLQVLAQTNGLPLLLLQFPPIAQSWQQEFRRMLGERKGTTVAVFMEDVNQTMGGLLRAMQTQGGMAC